MVNKKIFASQLVAFTFILFTVTSLAQVNKPSANRLLIYNAKIIDIENEEVRKGSLLIEDGKVVQEFEKKPEGYQGKKLHAKRRYLMPGLYDMHVHSSSNKSLRMKDMPPIHTKNSAKVMLYTGITGFLDLFANEDQIFQLRKKQRSGNFLGADIYAAGPILTAPQGHGTQFGTETRTVSNPNDAKKTINSLAKRKPDVIKIVYNPAQAKNISMKSMDLGTMQTLIKQAKVHNLKTVAHFGSWQDAYQVVKAGVSAITHTRSNSVPDSLISLMQEKGTYWIPTLSVYTEGARLINNPKAFQDPLLQTVTDSALRRSYKFNVPKKVQEFSQRSTQIKNNYLKSASKLFNAGIPVLAGTDSGNVGTFLGYSLHRELQLYVEAGMSKWKALESATILPGRFLGNETGVQPGDQASFLLLNESPLENITNSKSISDIIFHGKLLNRSNLLNSTDLKNQMESDRRTKSKEKGTNR